MLVEILAGVILAALAIGGAIALFMAIAGLLGWVLGELVAIALIPRDIYRWWRSRHPVVVPAADEPVVESKYKEWEF